MPVTDIDIPAGAIARLLAAVVLGALIGVEREASDQPAGLRTHISVALGASLFGVISTIGFAEYVEARSDTNINVDVARVASNVVMGIGFLGAGLMFRQGGEVRNVTTAASLWVTAAIGLAAGVGDIGMAGLTTVALLASLVLLRPLRGSIRRYLVRDVRELRIVLRSDADAGPVVTALQAIPEVQIDRLWLGKEQGAFVVVADLHAHRSVLIGDRLAPIAARDDVVTMTQNM